jgi:hypothetical protein
MSPNKYLVGEKLNSHDIHVDELFLDNTDGAGASASKSPPKEIDLFANFDSLSVSPGSDASAFGAEFSFPPPQADFAVAKSTEGENIVPQDQEDPFKPFDMSLLS